MTTTRNVTLKFEEQTHLQVSTGLYKLAGTGGLVHIYAVSRSQAGTEIRYIDQNGEHCRATLHLTSPTYLRAILP